MNDPATGPSDERPHISSRLPATAALTRTAVDAVGVDGGAVALSAPSSHARDLLYATDEVSARIDELQFTVGEGPCLDAFRDSEIRGIPDIADTEATGAWPTFTSVVIEELDVHALLVCPLTVDGAVLGVLELYRYAASPFTTRQLDAASALAPTIAATVLAELGCYAGALDPPTEDRIRENHELARTDIDVAIGMLAARLPAAMSDADALLRAHAFSQSRSISSIAHDIVHEGAAPDFGPE